MRWIEDWRRGIALVILWAYAYQLVAWPMIFWITTIFTLRSGVQWPAPPVVPWEQLISGTTTLAAVGGIQTWRERQNPSLGDEK
ncbi:MAG: hypothetical protein OEU93_19080 [Rubrivivax sp.]|nr:hypothetical protein [Rubrivivax sp.]